MKKSFKFIVLAMLLCVGFVFTGCGGGQLDSQVKVDVGNEKDYVACTEQDNFMVAMESLENSEDAGSEETEEAKTQTIKFTISAKLELVEGLINPEAEDPTAKVEVSLLANAMISMYEENDEEKVGAAAKITLNVGEEKVVYELYLKDNYLYANNGEEKIKVDMSEMMGDESSSMPDFDPSVIIDPIMEAVQNFEQQKVLKKGSKSIYQLELGEGQYLYIVINENAISQVYVQLNDFDISGLLTAISPELEMLGEMPLDFEISLELSESAIQYPTFDEYKDPTAEVA